MNLYCPYCEHDCGDHFDDQHEANVDYEHECENCGKIFQFSIEYEPSFISWETPCLNGEEHKFEKITGFPKEYFENKRRCEYCSKECHNKFYEKDKILHLTLKKKSFDLIKEGKKKIEYREIKPYWRSRLVDKKTSKVKIFDFIIFTNGYRKNSPKLKVEWKGVYPDIFEGKTCFAIKLGKVEEIKQIEENLK